MPEYLAPGVYVEEVDTGSKPIEGVSTSTAGMIGVTERGPVNIPILITSYGEYRRWFGDALDPTLYEEHRFLPHAVEGFFNNGGKRVFLTRVLEPGAATAASCNLVAEHPVPASTQLLRGAGPGTAQVVAISAATFTVGDTVQIGDGGDVEFRSLVAPLPSDAPVISMNLPLSHGHSAGSEVQVLTLTPATATALAGAARSGQDSIDLVSAADVAINPILKIGAGPNEELAVADPASIVGNSVSLHSPLAFDHAAATAVIPNAITGTSSNKRGMTAAMAGDTTLVTQTSAGTFAATDIVGISTPTATHNFDPGQSDAEVRRVSTLTRVSLDQPAYGEYSRNSLVERVTMLAAVATGTLSEDAIDGASSILLADRSNLAIGDILEIGSTPEHDLAEVTFLPAPMPGANPGRVVLANTLRFAHPAGTAAFRRRLAAPPTDATYTAVTSAAGSTAIITAGAASLAALDFLRVTPPSGTHYYHTAASAPVVLTPQFLTLDSPLNIAKAASAPVVRRIPIMEVRAIDAGRWGNRLRVAMEVQDALLVTQVRGAVLPGNALRLESAAGVESGTELEISSGTNTIRVKVSTIDRQNDALLTLESAPPLPGWVGAGVAVRTIEYRFVLDLLRQPDPANPGRNGSAIDREIFTNLSLDPRHSRYFERIIGVTWDLVTPGVTDDDGGRPLRRSDRRSEGESVYIRVRDLAPSTGVRTGPAPLYEHRKDGTLRLILLPLTLGDDVFSAFLGQDMTYVGLDSPDPERRTGLFTLRNIEEISIVAAPGRTSVVMQSALINHCELMRYRFAVLDGQPPPNDAMADIQAQRQQFDTKYAALYHPWLLIPDPYPVTTGNVPDYPIPPSGHMVGIYARTDIERGVHKAPANEVVRAITGLQRVLNKEQQDILNPYPVNINVIRDFRPNNRGIRVYGGRCITSDSDWKYVNVRRLIIFIEASVDRGLQWVVFEPNAEPLWARVRRSISNFLTLLWRNGALEGTKPEEAYFVKCDRTTMTQTDIDQGRLICLVGVAPVKPAEFVIVRIGLWTANADN